MDIKTLWPLLNSIHGCTFASLDTSTKPVLKGGKKNPHHGRIIKKCKNHRVMLFTNKNINGYEAMVKRRLTSEGKDPSAFVLGKLPWGIRIPESPLIVHNEKYYIQMIFLVGGTVEYLLDSEPISVEDVIGLDDSLPEGQAGLTDIVTVRTFQLDNIDAIRLMGEEIT